MGFQEIEIEKFRGIEHLAIADFKQVNLIAGGNNSGKSSILESIFMLTGISNPNLSLRVNNFREYQIRESEDLNLIFYNLKTSNSVLFKGSLLKNSIEERRELLISPVFSNSLEIDKPRLENDFDNSLNVIKEKLIGLNLNFSIEENNNQIVKNSAKIIADQDKTFKIIKAENYTEKVSAIFINAKYSFGAVVERLDKIITNKQDQDIVDILKNIESKISKITISANRIIKVDIGLPLLIPINVMGEGIKKLLAIITALYETKDGILLIDEIDNGLHYTTLKTLWKAIIFAAQKFNVQVFATTHNIETLKYLKDLINEEIGDFAENVRHYTLKKLPSGELKSYLYDFEKFEYALEQGIEIR
jgi:AAA15 family ATPase/GTPase